MILIFGGAYQGKLEYALELEEAHNEQIFTCTKDKAEIDFNKKIIYHLEEFVFACLKEGIEAREYLEENIDKLENKVVICDDISMGIVPMDEEERAWREAVGRAMIYLGKVARRVDRVFCGIGGRIK